MNGWMCGPPADGDEVCCPLMKETGVQQMDGRLDVKQLQWTVQKVCTYEGVGSMISTCAELGCWADGGD